MIEMDLRLVPDPDDVDGTRVLVPAWADGLEVELLLDTGAASTTLPHLDELASLPTRQEAGGYGASGQRIDRALVVVDRFRAGPFERERLEVALLPADSPAPPVLGMDLLGSRCCEFRISEQRLVVDPEHPAADPLPLRRQVGGQPLVEVRVGATTTSAVWDTGASLTVVDKSWARAHPHAVTAVSEASEGRDATGASVASATSLLADCRIGDTTFPESRCAVVDLGPLNARLAEPIEVILGLSVIGQATWWMDFPENRWSVSRP
ncbi:retropepsin-like aspartic protease [Nocardioides donggukensis]|uniref:Retropepsin-like domain-containing protein n=1 Tax=Nocardioides donggukensis TaxID=2774019 RepID=A0A927K2R0_9ACTN|nr:retropepsin-like aspartic protease [Nocardioides donggukensis]MBD8868443.1 retropepsin-like domain-containing protein [Nocardioides donggukensis]